MVLTSSATTDSPRDLPELQVRQKKQNLHFWREPRGNLLLIKKILHMGGSDVRMLWPACQTAQQNNVLTNSIRQQLLSAVELG